MHAWISPAANPHLSIQAAAIRLDPALGLKAVAGGRWEDRGLQQGAGGEGSVMGGQKYEGRMGGDGHRGVGGDVPVGQVIGRSNSPATSDDAAAALAAASAAGRVREAGAAAAPAATSPPRPSAAGGAAGQLDCSRLARGALPAGSQLVINAGTGEVVVHAKGWMDGLRARFAAGAPRTNK